MFKNDKLRAYFNELNTKYTDSLGRICYQGSKNSDWEKGDYDSLNQHLWTGEYALLLWHSCNKTQTFNAFNSELQSNLKKILKETSALTKISTSMHLSGLYARHPYPYRYTNQYDPISLDEYFGILSTVMCTQALVIPHSILGYAKKVNWFISDRPGHEEKKPRILSFTSIKEILKLVWAAIKQKDFTGSNELDKIIYASPILSHLTRWWLPKDRVFFYLSAHKEVPWYCYLHLKLAAKSTLRESNNETSGKILLFFKILFFQTYFSLHLGIENLEIRNSFYKISQEYHQKMISKYGHEYLKVVFEKYFEDKNHPFIKIAAEFKFDLLKFEYHVTQQ